MAAFLGVSSTIERKQINMPDAHTLGTPYALVTIVPRDTEAVRGEALRDTPVPDPW